MKFSRVLVYILILSLLYLLFSTKETFFDEYAVKIPRIILQTDRLKPKQYIIDKFKKYSPNWKYIHYNDDEIIQFFIDNPVEEFKDIIIKFNKFKKGQHKADLFRYYFIYVKGGVFVDSDAMIQKDLDDIVKDYEFFSVDSLNIHNEPAIFQGLLGAVPKNEIIYKALVDAYYINHNNLDYDYFLICKNLHKIIYNDKIFYKFKIKLFNERIAGAIAESYDPSNNEIVLMHYFTSKVIPE